MSPHITYAEVAKDGQGNLVSTLFDDIYFSKEDGEQESRYVFFEQNNLPQRWQQNQDFTICETGFGTGLNFLIAYHLWQQHGLGNKLTFLTVEKYPLTEEDMRYAWSFFTPELTTIKEPFFIWYNNLTTGLNIFEFQGVELVLWVGDVVEFLPQMAQLNHAVDSWFLDGFAPSKNEGMWQQSLWQAMVAQTAPKGTFATFTAAGFVKRGLQEAGFTIEKIKGYGRKREMLKGKMQPERLKYYLDLSVGIPVKGLPSGLSLESLAECPVSAELLGELLYYADQGTIDYEGETLAEAITEIRGTLEGKYGPLLQQGSYVLKANGQIKSAVLMVNYENMPLVAHIFTAPEVKGRGFAKAVLARGVIGLREAGCSNVMAVITEGNVPSEKVHLSVGFKREASTDAES